MPPRFLAESSGCFPETATKRNRKGRRPQWASAFPSFFLFGFWWFHQGNCTTVHKPSENFPLVVGQRHTSKLPIAHDLIRALSRSVFLCLPLSSLFSSVFFYSLLVGIGLEALLASGKVSHDGFIALFKGLLHILRSLTRRWNGCMNDEP